MALLPPATDFTAAATQGALKTAITGLIDYLTAALGTDSAGGGATGPKNLLINGALTINQRGFAGGALGAGAYGFDRWKAGTGGCTVSVTSGVVTLTGPLVQVIESPDLAGAMVTVSVEDPSGDLTARVNGVSGTITAGSGRRGVTLTVPGGSTGNVALTLAPTSGSRTFARVQMERGPAPTTFERRPIGAELALCQRYCYVLAARAVGSLQTAGATVYVRVGFPVTLRAAPTISGGAGNVWDGIDAQVVDGFGVYAVNRNAVIGSGITFSAEL